MTQHSDGLYGAAETPTIAMGTKPRARPDSPHLEPTRNEWFGFANYWAREHGRGRYIYVPDPGGFGWWAYVDNVWRPLSAGDPRLHDELARYRYQYADELVQLGMTKVADALAQGFVTMVGKGERGDLLVGLRAACAGDLPQPEPYHIGTPRGIVDLRDGSWRPHAPEFGIRALTEGDFRPNDLPSHYGALQSRLDRVFDRETQEQFIRLIALALTRKAQSYRAIVMILGASGSGKGDACNVVLRALKEMAMGVGAEWIAQQQRNEIDSIGAAILERQPVALHVDEVGGDTRIGFSRLNTLTGNAEKQFRRPHGALLKGRPCFQVWTTCVDVPTLPRKEGMDRRLAVLRTISKIEEREVDEDGGSDPALLDAVVTLACIEAQEVYVRGYAPPEGNPHAKADALADMDRVADWLEWQDDLHGMAVSEARKRALADLEIDDRDLSAKAFASRLASSNKWAPHRGTAGKRGIRQRGEQLNLE